MQKNRMREMHHPEKQEVDMRRLHFCKHLPTNKWSFSVVCNLWL